MRNGWWVIMGAVLACGGRLSRPTASHDAAATPARDGTVDHAGDTAGDVGAGCPGSVVQGGACRSAVSCPAADGCNTCFCAGGTWHCDTGVCATDAGGCAGGSPRTGEACSIPGSVCDQGAGCVGTHCVCAGGRWTCDPLVCVDP